MTALKQYSRLESFGLWRPALDAPARSVVVSFGNATLVLSDDSGRPLTHWSLPAIRALPRTDDATVSYSPDLTGDEQLTLDDALMIEALAKVMAALDAPQKRRLPLRLFVLGSLVTLAVAVMVFLPILVRNQTLSVVPLAKRAEIGATILGHMQAESGTSCRDPFGVRALDQLRRNALGPNWRGQIVVLPGPPFAPAVLPGRTIVLSQQAITRAADPAELAALVIATATAPTSADALRPLLEDAGFAATASLLTTGDLPQAPMVNYAHKLLEQSLPPVTAAGSTPVAGDVLNDNDWVGLLGICNN
ncbi:hypothetical protein [Ketogulonicigenium vulgare]|uniref:Uncharacterized protein n=1 Tax=Ketogulonicigenium vulgare (strain WSH-001) TaxID=759362 RepID=F9YAM7_KETVW|nr:hypothetical protein [Ketogulonicigenium vulgare]ADO43265.1 conserved hypothetical protein [Ketogulonicigenium vulgare Y25]AEM41558.1 hypothetical protein KVU_1719 [Ketogulonicigenium vulgare WSH-001]ALJ81677.1 hypothetical protein KVH_11175 [Ketogulonicigenium vulgare]ANW34347.1 hypothetical protein KvSKV_11090 [Ketogulonicigenium vulgare]AOZ55302.1 hypothetical protein KVC_2297 [Ketogulonicigenium vulgare]